MTDMIETSELTKVFERTRALDGLNMHVPEGAIYGLVGPNGAGKTTALHHIAGMMRPTSGEARVGDELVFERPETKARIAYVPSDFYHFRQASIHDMQALHAALFPRFDNARFERLANVFGIDPSLPVRSLSKGMKKQVALWLALSQQADVLLLDEPLDGFDPSARHTVLGVVMDEVAARGMTVLVSSHNLRELTDICDHVGIMEAGRMRIERSLIELQGGFAKVQVAFETTEAHPPEELDIIHSSAQGKLHTLVIRGDADEIERVLVAGGATFVNVLPLSLEEIFIYEMGGSRYEDGILD